MTESELDALVWDAHFQRRLPEDRALLRVVVPISRVEWRRYWKKLRAESRGYWHGATGRLAERLGIDESGWQRMAAFHLPGGAKCLGDSSHDYSWLIERAAVFPQIQRSVIE